MPDKRKDSDVKNTSGKKSKLEGEISESMTYDPVHFIRSHSKNNDPADIQTQVILRHFNYFGILNYGHVYFGPGFIQFCFADLGSCI